MKPDEFLKYRLGWLSSHPTHQASRRRWAQGLALVPLALVLLLVLLLGMDYENWVTLIRNSKHLLILIGATISFALGALITLSLCARWAELQLDGKLNVRDTVPSVLAGPVAIWALVLGFGLPLVAISPLSEILRLPNSIVFACHLFAVLPLLGCLLGMWVAGGKPDNRQETRKRRPIWMLLTMLILALMLVTFLHDMGTVLNKTALSNLVVSLLPQWYKTNVPPFSGLLVLAALAYALFVVWQMFPATVAKKKEPPKDAEKRPGLLTRFGGWLKRLFLPEGDSDPSENANPWPSWLDDLLAERPAGCTTSGPQRLESYSEAPTSDADHLKVFFGGVVPTTDQLTLFDRFRQSYQEVIRDGWVGQSRGHQPSADLLVEGDAGSGRSTTLMACAVYAALGRGQRVVYLVPNRRRQQAIKQRIDEILASVQLNHYIHTEIITREAVEGWLSGTSESPPALPQIFVGTLDSFERELFGATHVDEKQFQRLRRLLLLMEVVLVDDFTEFDDAQRSHLPFVLDKHRLLLETDFIPLQVVVTCPQLAATARRVFGTRLYTDRRLQTERDIICLRPRASGTAWRVDLEARNVRDAVEKMVVWCLERQLNVVLYRKGIDESERRRQEHDLWTRAGRKQQITVISDLDQPLGVPAGEVEAVFYQVAAHQDICLALRMNFGNRDSVIFSVRPAGEIRDVPVTGIVPVVAARSAEPLAVAHLHSVVRFLRTGTPVPENVWSLFGLALGNKVPTGRPAKKPETIFRHDSWEEEDTDYAARLFPYLTVHHTGRIAARPVDTYALPDERGQLLRLGRQPVYFLGQRQDKKPDDPRNRRAEWYGSDDQPLGRATDLAHAREFRLVHGTEVFVPQLPIEKNEFGFRIRTKHWSGTGEDHYLPAYTVEWELFDPAAKVLGGGPDFAMLWFNLETVDDQPVQVAATIERLMTEYGIETPLESIEFGYPARLCGILFQPCSIRDGSLEATIGAGLAGHWGTAGQFNWSAALTGAVNYALHARLPGLSFFAQSLSFWIPESEDRVGLAATWFLEPVTVGRTVMEVLGKLLENAEERLSLLRSVQWFLDQCNNVDDPSLFIRRFSRVSYFGEEAIDDLPQLRDLISDVLNRTETQIGRRRD